MFRFANLFFLTIFLWTGANLAAQSGILDEYVQMGIQNNNALKSHQLSYEKSVERLREAKGLFYPQVSFIANYTVAGGGRTLDFPVGDLFNPVYATLNSLQDVQKFPTDLENVNEQFLPNNFQETKIRVIQPIVNSDILFNYRAQQSLISMEATKRAAYKEELIKEIRTAYFNYLKSEAALKIYDRAFELVTEILRVNKRLVENDKATPEVVFQAEHELSKVKESISLAQQQQQTSRAYMNFLLNRPLNEAIEKDSTLSYQLETPDLETWQEQATQLRQELKQLDHAQQANFQAVELNRFNVLPKVNAVLDLGYQGFGYKFDSDQQFWLAQFSLQWDLFKGFQNKSKLQQTRIDQKILSTQQQQANTQIQLQVQDAYYKWKSSQSAFEASQDGFRSAKEAFRITRKKYLEDQANLLSLTDARTRYTQAELSVAINQYEILIKETELAFAAGILSTQLPQE